MMDRQTTSPRFRSVRPFISALLGKEFHLNLQSFVWRRRVAALPRGIKMAAAKQQKHLSLSFAIETKNYYSRVLIIESNTSSSARTFQLAKKVGDNCSFDLRESLLILRPPCHATHKLQNVKCPL